MKERYVKISRRALGEERVGVLSAPPPCGRYLYAWLLLQPGGCLVPGVVPLGEVTMAGALGWELDGFRRAFSELSAADLAAGDWDHKLVWVKRRIYDDVPQSPNVMRSWERDWYDLPNCPLKSAICEELVTWATGYGEPWLAALEQALGQVFPRPAGMRSQKPKQPRLRQQRHAVRVTERLRPPKEQPITASGGMSLTQPPLPTVTDPITALPSASLWPDVQGALASGFGRKEAR